MLLRPMPLRPIACVLAALFVSSSVHADDFQLQRVLVEGARASQLGIAESAMPAAPVRRTWPGASPTGRANCSKSRLA
jgi:long-subunit fatty acid transport protein